MSASTVPAADAAHHLLAETQPLDLADLFDTEVVR
ncbi:hypothetical protein FHR78_001110 [Frigoribacterium faeni]|nr:hypothetical protein [Frigoribacterium faeni]